MTRREMKIAQSYAHFFFEIAGLPFETAAQLTAQYMIKAGISIGEKNLDVAFSRYIS